MKEIKVDRETFDYEKGKETEVSPSQIFWTGALLGFGFAVTIIAILLDFAGVFA